MAWLHVEILWWPVVAPRGELSAAIFFQLFLLACTKRYTCHSPHGHLPLHSSATTSSTLYHHERALCISLPYMPMLLAWPATVDSNLISATSSSPPRFT